MVGRIVEIIPRESERNSEALLAKYELCIYYIHTIFVRYMTETNPPPLTPEAEIKALSSEMKTRNLLMWIGKRAVFLNGLASVYLILAGNPIPELLKVTMFGSLGGGIGLVGLDSLAWSPRERLAMLKGEPSALAPRTQKTAVEAPPMSSSQSEEFIGVPPPKIIPPTRVKGDPDTLGKVGRGTNPNTMEGHDDKFGG